MHKTIETTKQSFGKRLFHYCTSECLIKENLFAGTFISADNSKHLVEKTSANSSRGWKIF